MPLGRIRRVSMEVSQAEKVRKLDIAQMLGLSEEECCCDFDQESNSYCVSFDKHKVQVPQILEQVMKITEVKDMQIRETELADIVKEIYNNGVD